MIPSPQNPKMISHDARMGVIEIEGLYPSYGLTIGNALRRVLLSSLPGAAATSVKIAGAKHEFSTLSGIREDSVEITLNLKQIRFRLFDDEPQRIILTKKGIGQVTAADFTLPSQVEIANPEQHIATLTERNAQLDLELVIENGLGYQPVEERKIGKLPIGEIALDAIFTPIRKVATEIENMRVGDRTDYNRLRLIIETDGTTTPQAAFRQAVSILMEQFQALGEFALVSKAAISAAAEEETLPAQEEKRGDKDNFKKRVEELDVPTRVSNSLIRAGIKTIGGLLNRTEQSLLNLEGLGEGSVKEIKKELGRLGLTLKK